MDICLEWFYQQKLNSTCKCNRILINKLLIIRTQKVAFIS